jgi:superfamily II DNA or RNA helicase
MSFSTGSLVRARGREWVVLPESEGDMLILRPLGGTDDEVAGIYLPLENVSPAQFELPDPAHVGDQISCRLLRDAVRLTSRASAGPFRSFARIACEPRPYQLVPLLMALKQDSIRMLIADDVGVGKTIEACLIAREMLDRGEITSTTVLCPPHLAEQWQKELADKFHIPAELVLTSTVARLERNIRVGRSLFEAYPHTVVSMDYIKSDKRRHEFLRACPELVIVDEAHTCAHGYEGRGRHQRHQLLRDLMDRPDSANRHLILVTATPHSGKDEAFRSMLGLLDRDFLNLPDDLAGQHNEKQRRRLAQHFIQRRRGDIRAYLDTETKFPQREEAEEHYKLTPGYRKLIERVLDYTSETIIGEEGSAQRRVRWWSALALLRATVSSPAAAAASLRNRSPVADAQTEEEADEIGRRTVLDLAAEELTEGVDIIPGTDITEDEGTAEAKAVRRRLLQMARDAEELMGKGDAKLVKAVKLIRKLIKDGYSPIVFCRFIATAEYVAEELNKRLSGVEVAAVTGTLPPADREARVLELAEADKHVLVCTECLSEGINLQKSFDAVMHYDLSWNPTRHEQREGRVDRYGQDTDPVRILTYWGEDNPIDGIVLAVILRKHRSIRNALGISVPIPSEGDALMSALIEGIMLREHSASEFTQTSLFPNIEPRIAEFESQWDRAADREKLSRTMFAQVPIKVNDIARELAESREAVGSAADIQRFTCEAVQALGGVVQPHDSDDAIDFKLAETPRALRDLMGLTDTTEFSARFELPCDEHTRYLSRTHPNIEGMAAYVRDTTLDTLEGGVAKRAGAIRTNAVPTRTTLLLVRYRFEITSPAPDGTIRTQIAEDCHALAFTGAPEAAQWITDEAAVAALFDAEPSGNIHPEQKTQFVSKVVEGYDALGPHVEESAHAHAEALKAAHTRVRKAARMTAQGQVTVTPKLPPDVLGIYVLLPQTKGRTV